MHLVFAILILVVLALLLGGGILVLLVLGHKIVHVGLGFGEFHLVHTFAGVPVKEGLAAEHTRELLRHTFEHFLDSGGVTNEGGGHLQSLGGDVAHGGLDVIGDPLHKVRGVLVLDVKHLLIDLLGGHASTEEARGGQVTAVTGIGGAHHVLGIELLLGELGNGEGTVLLGSTGREWGKAEHEEVKTGERDEIHRQLTQVRVQLTWESEAASAPGHGRGHQVVQVTVRGGGELEGTEADIVEGFVIEAHHFIGVLHQLVDGKGGVVGLDHGIGHLGGGHDGEGEHDTVGVFLADLGDEESSHTGTGTATKRVGHLEALKAIAGLGFLADNVEDGVNKFGTFGVVTLGPVITGTGLSKDEVIGAEELSEGTGTDGVHGTGLEIHQNGTGHVTSTGGFVVVHVDALQLKVGVTMVGTGGVHTVFIGDNLPELGTNLVTALSSLNVNDFAL